MAWRDKYGSPYDPRYAGKQRNPEQRRQEERQETRYQIRGCGDPGCDICNSHIPREVARAMRPVRPSANYFEGVVPNNAAARNMNAMRYLVGVGESPSPPQAGPPASYVSARKEVEQWLVVASEQEFDDIVGNDEALEQLRDAIQAPVKHKELYEAYGMKMPKGALLSGPPGCGKTMFARAAASEMRRLYGDKVEFLSISGSEIQEPFVGVTEKHITNIFAFAKEYKAHHGHPLLVFMDEADVLLPDRTGRVRRVAPWEESQVATFLAEMDGITESGAFMLLASNRPEVIDQAVLRDGRCDFKITVKRPTMEAIEGILQKNFAKCKLLKDTAEELVFAALECFQNPHSIIVEFHALGFEINFEKEKIDQKHHEQKHFLLQHIISGAMAASVPARAIRHAFSRDKAKGKALGVTSMDVVSAVRDIYEENKKLDHSYALEEFRAEFMSEVKAKYGEKNGQG
jgi:SpoVK/Ycf46/Vps4 family AAA+-type ATPase